MTGIAIAIFLISAAALGLELALVRALSIGHWHHFSYLIISTALLGFGAGGVFVAVGSKRLTANYRPWLWYFALGLAASVPAVFWVSQKVPFDELQLIWDRRQVIYLFTYYLLFFVPFFFAGGGIGLAFTVLGGKAHRLYFFNMAGSGLGAAAMVALMYGNSPERLLLVISGLAFAAAIVLALGVSWRAAIWTMVAAQAWLFLFSGIGPMQLEINMSEHKGLVFYRELPSAVLARVRYGPLGRLDCVRAPTIRHFSGLSMTYEGQLPQQMLIITDGDGASAINHFRDMNDLECFDYMTSALAYHLVDRPQVCVIGAGGGSDVVQALAAAAKKVTAVEMNAQTVELVRQRFGRFASGLYRRGDVEVVVAEGRSFLQTPRAPFDIISISLLDSYSASAAGVGAFNESHLYTIEAVAQALSRLRPKGLLSVTRALKTPARDNLKMFATVAEALRRRGVMEPGGHIMMIRGLGVATIVVSPLPFSSEQVAGAREFARRRSFDLVHLPGLKREQANQFNVFGEGPLYYDCARELLSEQREEFYRNYAYNIRPATDDRPYFFDFFKWKSLPHILGALGRQGLRFTEWGYLVLVATFVQAVLAGAAFILLPLWAAKPVRTVRSGKLVTLTYFLLLGLAYMFLEMGFIQKMTLLIGHPVFGVAVTLAGFLLFSGFGALVSERIGIDEYRLIWIAVSALIIVGTIEIVLIKVCFAWLVGFSRLVRMALGVGLAAPLAFFMGVPFPTALRRLHGDARPLVPWAWGINGFASVTGAVLGTILAISAGFTPLALVAFGCYVLAALASKQICARGLSAGQM
ncbi:MAG: SAM-dependent methyltransferase [Planctomycetota bacterium]|jgi:spermidine synthase